MKSVSHYFKSQIGYVPRNLGQNCTEVFVFHKCGAVLHEAEVSGNGSQVALVATIRHKT